MNRPCPLRSLAVLSVGALFVAATSAPIAKGREDAETLKEQKRLTGLWRVDVFVWQGERSTAKEFEEKHASSDIFNSRWHFTATEAEWVVNPDYKFVYARYKLNLQARPKAIDLKVYGSTFKGIYSLDDKKLKVCFSVRSPGGRKLEPGKEGRPTDFTTKNPERMLFIFVRDEKPEK